MELENTPRAILSHSDRPLHMTRQKKLQKGWYMESSYCKYCCLDCDATYSKVEIDFADEKY